MSSGRPTGSVAREGKRRISVLLVDADPLTRRALRAALTEEPDLEVVAEAADRDEALRVAIAERPDVVLVDAELTGADRAAELRTIVRAVPSSAIVVLSVAVDDQIGLALLHAGASGYLGKGTDPTSLPRVVRAVANGEPAISRQLTIRLVEMLRGVSPRAEGIRPVKSDLSSTQWEVIDLLRKRLPETEIAAQLGITEAAVRRHLRVLQLKLGAASAEEIVEIASRLVAEAAQGSV